MDRELLERAKEVLDLLKRRDSNESRLLGSMMKLPEKYDWGDFDVRLQVSVDLCGARLEISRLRAHSTSEPWQFRLVSDDGGVVCFEAAGGEFVAIQ